MPPLENLGFPKVFGEGIIIRKLALIPETSNYEYRTVNFTRKEEVNTMLTRFSSKGSLLKGGEMMRILGLACLLVLVASAVCSAATAMYDVYQGFNLIAAPIVPFNSDPTVVFAGSHDGVDGTLSRWDPTNGGVYYDSLDPGGFGNILLGEGYWLQQTGTGHITIDGVLDGVPDGSGKKTDMWISLPGNQADAGVNPPSGGGWHLIGNPFDDVIPVDSGSGVGDRIKFTDGTVLLNWSEAANPPYAWVSATLSGWTPAGGGVDVQFDGLGSDDSLRPGMGYWLQTTKDNIAMIILAPDTL